MATMIEPTDKQVGYALHLLEKQGFGVRYMSSSYKRLGATMRQRSGTVEDWLRGLTKREISGVIEQLKEGAKP